MATKNETPRKVKTKKHIARQEREQKQIKTIVLISGVIVGVALIILVYALVNSFIIKPNQVVASVGDTKITVSKFDSEVRYSRLNLINSASQYAEYAQMFGEMGTSLLTSAQNMVAQLDNTQFIGQSAVDRLIDDVLIQEEAKKLGVSVSDEEVSKGLEEAFGFYSEPTKTPTVTATPVSSPTLSSEQIDLIKPTNTPDATQTAVAEAAASPTPTTVLPTATATVEPTATTAGPTATATLEPTITPTPTPYTEKLYSQNLKSYLTNVSTVGVDRKQVEYSFRMQLLREKVLDALTKDLKPVEPQVWARHILVATEDEAKKVIEELNGGADWATLAATYSTDTNNKDNGGDLGWFSKGVMDAEFEAAAFAMNEVGHVSEPVQSQFGWHIIQLVGKAENPIDASRFETMKQDYFTNWLDTLRSGRTDIVINDDVWKPLTPSVPEVPTALRDAIQPTAVVPQPTTAPTALPPQ
ncbi:MAG: peptidylprolyl isomerase [Anaerolineaceae bacterium]